MSVVINEIEVLEPPSPDSHGEDSSPPPPPPVVRGEPILLLLRDAEGRQRRLVAD